MIKNIVCFKFFHVQHNNLRNKFGWTEMIGTRWLTETKNYFSLISIRTILYFEIIKYRQKRIKATQARSSIGRSRDMNPREMFQLHSSLIAKCASEKFLIILLPLHQFYTMNVKQYPDILWKHSLNTMVQNIYLLKPPACRHSQLNEI